MIQTDHSEHQVLATVESVGFGGTFAIRPWFGIEELQVAIEDRTIVNSRHLGWWAGDNVGFCLQEGPDPDD